MHEQLIFVRETFPEVCWLAMKIIAQAAHEAVRLRGAFSLALAGGTTPARLFSLLAEPSARALFPWEATWLYWGDERCVPPESPESNYHLADRVLLSRLSLRPTQVHRIPGEDPDPDHAAADYEQELPSRLDVLMLGIGEDGHIASLFPGSQALHEEERLVVAVTAPKPPPHRITITPPVIRQARQVLVLASGKSKAAAVAQALTGPADIDTVPARLVRKGIWLLDSAAASHLEERQLF